MLTINKKNIKRKKQKTSCKRVASKYKSIAVIIPSC